MVEDHKRENKLATTLPLSRQNNVNLI
jgi:hypothetical protein